VPAASAGAICPANNASPRTRRTTAPAPGQDLATGTGLLDAGLRGPGLCRAPDFIPTTSFDPERGLARCLVACLPAQSCGVALNERAPSRAGPGSIIPHSITPRNEPSFMFGSGWLTGMILISEFPGPLMGKKANQPMRHSPTLPPKYPPASPPAWAYTAGPRFRHTFAARSTRQTVRHCDSETLAQLRTPSPQPLQHAQASKSTLRRAPPYRLSTQPQPCPVHSSIVPPSLFALLDMRVRV
jgi:hypothetical protein